MDADERREVRGDGWRFDLYGKPGLAIPGSKYYRGYCAFCGDPIRVAKRVDAVNDACQCEDCLRPVLDKPGNHYPNKFHSDVQYHGGSLKRTGGME